MYTLSFSHTCTPPHTHPHTNTLHTHTHPHQHTYIPTLTQKHVKTILSKTDHENNRSWKHCLKTQVVCEYKVLNQSKHVFSDCDYKYHQSAITEKKTFTAALSSSSLRVEINTILCINVCSTWMYTQILFHPNTDRFIVCDLLSGGRSTSYHTFFVHCEINLDGCAVSVFGDAIPVVHLSRQKCPTILPWHSQTCWGRVCTTGPSLQKHKQIYIDNN